MASQRKSINLEHIFCVASIAGFANHYDCGTLTNLPSNPFSWGQGQKRVEIPV